MDESSELDRAGAGEGEGEGQREVWGPDPSRDDEADAALRNTREQERVTSLEGTEAGRSLEELAEGLERATDQPGYGREGM